MVWSALPDHLNPHINPDAWKGKDGEFKRWIKGWLAFGPRAKEKWAKFRELPNTLFKFGGEGQWRYESTAGNLQFTKETPSTYLSRIQPWKRWAFSVSWPFFIHFHAFYKKKDVLKYPANDTNHLDIRKCFVFDFGMKRDGDLVYWLTAFLGGRFE